MASPFGNIDLAGISGAYLGLLFLCGGFVAIGVFSSAISTGPVISFLVAVLLSYFFYTGFDFISALPLPAVISNIISQMGISEHYASMSRGVIDSRDIIYFLSLSVLFAYLTKFILEKRRW